MKKTADRSPAAAGPPREEPAAVSPLDRPAVGGLSAETASHLALLGLALVLRLVWLGYRPLHHDESIHAYYSWRIWTVGFSDYRYDPTYHGPALYYLTAALQWLFSPSDFSTRLLPVICGVGLVALAWPLRPLIGRAPALAFAALVTLSPTFGYYSRSLRHDVPMAFFTLAAVVAFLRFTQSGRRSLAYLAGAAIGLAAANKEDIYLTGVTFAIALAASGLWSDADRTRPFVERAKVWLGDIVRFLRERWMPVASAVLIAASLSVVLYTSVLTRPENWNFVTKALSYWMGQHRMQRIGGPWWYYLPLEVTYESLIFLPALLTAVRWARQGTATREQAFLFAWAVVSFVLYAWAQEKVPWLLVPFLVPQALLAADYFAGLELQRLAAWSPLALFTVWSLVASNFLYDAPRTTEPPEATHNEPLVYVQSTYDVRDVLGTIESVGEKLGTAKKTPLVVVGDATWPLSWYLRDYPVHWSSLPTETSAPVLIVDPDDAGRLEKDLGTSYTRKRFAVRGWWQIEWDKISAANVLRFLVYRLTWNPPGTTDAVMLVATDLDARKTREAVRLRPAPPQKTYIGNPTPLPAAARALGGPGAGPGQLREPRGLAFDRNGDLWVADSANHRIQKLDDQGNALVVVGGPEPGDGPGRFRSPGGIAVAPDGSVVVADTWNHRIQKLDTQGRFLLEWRETDPPLWGPRAVAVAPDGTIFVADTGNKRILAFDGQGHKRFAFGGDGSEDLQFVEPVGLAVDPTEPALYIADTGNHRVQKVGLDGAFRAKWTVFGWLEFYTEPYLAWGNDTLWATDSFNHRLNAYDRTGNLVRSLGGTGGAIDFDRPVGVAVSPQGQVAVSDISRHRLVVLP